MKSFAVKIHNSFRLDGHSFDPRSPGELPRRLIGKGDAFSGEMGEFIKVWTSPEDTIELQTSGSTGKPKKIRVKKRAMVNSALATGQFFGLESGNTALLCLPVQYIAGKMMLVRAMVLGLELDSLEPTNRIRPISGKHYDFCAVVPTQLEESRDNLHQFATVIVGGAAVPGKLEEELKDHPCDIYATYGMTETLTHVAVRKLGRDKDYTALPGVEFSIDHRECLTIKAPHLRSEPLTTNDVVKLLSKHRFELLGRWDHVINSGGVKLFPEEIEKKLHHRMKFPFFMASEKDDKLGERLIMVVEHPGKFTPPDFLFEDLHPYEKPRKIYTLSGFEYTESAKINRPETMNRLGGAS
ncbi:MAG: O-succinylbenzoic acid--CoA ligase [Saprospirales bacterium]|nr:MAG: O-succinylbenzoic acid--CoA ligase [Saprospirales bacterium]